jgi:drug/metabolite transporter (DMT)-like permease
MAVARRSPKGAHCSPHKTKVLTMTVNPIAAGLLAATLAGEPITLNPVLGLAAVFAGIRIATTKSDGAAKIA